MPAFSGSLVMGKQVFVGSLFLFVIYIIIAGAVDKSVSPSELDAIVEIFGDTSCRQAPDFQSEVECIKSMQLAKHASVPKIKCAGWAETIEPDEFLKRGYGCCFDRARLLEKALQTQGYDVRRVALYDTSVHGWLSAFVPQIPSHAASEVKTSRGWMGVESNAKIVLVSEINAPMTFAQLYTETGRLHPDIPLNETYKKPMSIVYGLYSRHGMCHGLNLPAPEIHWPDFLRYNFFADL